MYILLHNILDYMCQTNKVYNLTKLVKILILNIFI
jgi:hypothetical protein